jgi:hypothetical protein
MARVKSRLSTSRELLVIRSQHDDFRRQVDLPRRLPRQVPQRQQRRHLPESLVVQLQLPRLQIAMIRPQFGKHNDPQQVPIQPQSRVSQVDGQRAAAHGGQLRRRRNCDSAGADLLAAVAPGGFPIDIEQVGPGALFVPRAIAHQARIERTTVVSRRSRTDRLLR